MGDEEKPDKDKAETPPSEDKNLTKIDGQEEVIPAEIIKELPPEVQKQFRAILATFQAQIGPRTNPLFSKFTEAHIDKYLDYLQRDDDHAHELSRTNRWFYLAYFVIAVLVLAAAIVYLLPRDKDFLILIIQFLILLAGGIGAGYGLSKRNKN